MHAMIVTTKPSANNMVCIDVIIINQFSTIILIVCFILGIKGKSIFFKLQATKFPQSFPVDMMHLFFENITEDMYKHWHGLFFNDNSEN